MRQSYQILAAVMLLALLAGACTAPAPAPVAQPEAPAAEAPAETPTEAAAEEPTPVEEPAEAGPERIEELVVAQFGNPVNMTCWDWAAVDEIDILAHFAEPLFRFRRDGTLEGVVAESWEMVSPSEWILNIRQGMKFHDPEYGELDAEDVIASLEACFDPERLAIKKQPGVIAGMQLEALDDYTVKVTLPEPGTAGLPNNWTYTFISSKEYLEEVGDDFNQRPMGTGPFKFVSWEPNVEIIGERFEDYWGPDPNIERIVWRIIPDAFTRKSEFLTGGIDVLPFMQAEWVSEVEDNPDVRTEGVLSARYIMVILPVQVPPFDDQRVRQALNYAINKQEIVDQLFLGVGAVPPTGIVNPILPEGRPDNVVYPYDPEKAMELLDEARADGVEIGTITLNATNDRYVLDKELGEAIAGYWRAVGLDVEYVPMSRTELFPISQALEATNPHQVGFGNTQLRADYPMFLWLQTRTDPPSRGSAYAAGPPEWDDMITELGSLSSGSPESIALAQELDDLWIDYAPWAFVINYVDLYGVSNDVEWTPYPFESRFFVDVTPRAAE